MRSFESIVGANLRGVAFLLCVLTAACASKPEPTERPGALAHYQKARMFFEQGRIPDAFDEIDRSLRMDRSLPQVWFYRGYMQWTLEQWGKAEADFREALARNLFYTDARMYLAVCLNEQGRSDEALAELDKALADRTFPTPEQIHLNKAKILEDRSRWDEALAELRQAVTVQPRFYQGHYKMGLVLAKLRRLEEADVAFAQAEPGFSRDADYHLHRGEVLFEMQRTDDARRELRRTQELAPGSEAAGKASELLKKLG